MDENNVDLDDVIENGDAMAIMSHIQGLQPEKVEENEKVEEKKDQIPESIKIRIDCTGEKVYFDRYKVHVEKAKKVKENLIGQIKECEEEQKKHMAGDVFYKQVQEIIEKKTREKEKSEDEEKTYEKLMKTKAKEIKEKVVSDIKIELSEIQNKGKEISDKIKEIKEKRHEQMKRFHDAKEIEEMDEQINAFNEEFNELKQKAQELNMELKNAEKIMYIEGVKIEQNQQQETLEQQGSQQQEQKPDKKLSNAELLEKAQIESMIQENDYVEQPYIAQPKPEGKVVPEKSEPKEQKTDKKLSNAELLEKAQIESMIQEDDYVKQPAPQQTGKKITEFDILRTPKGIWIGDKIFIENKRIAKLEEKDLPEEIKVSVKEGKLGAFQDTKILKALTIYAKENKDVDLKGIMDNYADLVAKGKQDSDKSKIGYDIRAGISYLRPSVRKEIKEMKKLALSTKQYTSFYGNAISRRIFERKSIKQDKKLLQNKKVIGLNPGEQKAKSDIINGLNNNIKQQMQENQKNNFQNEIKFRPNTPYEAKQQEDINKAVKEMQNKALADEIKKAVDRKIEEEDKGDL